MTNWREINEISKDPQAVRSLARRLLKLPYMSWPEHGRGFLENMAKEREPITTRQAEYLIELRDETELHQVVGGFFVGSLIEDCWRNREPDRGEALRVDHSTAGARIAAERYAQLGRLLAYVIAGHHAGLANGTGHVMPITKRTLAISGSSILPRRLQFLLYRPL
jgi:hypothetical protein